MPSPIFAIRSGLLRSIGRTAEAIVPVLRDCLLKDTFFHTTHKTHGQCRKATHETLLRATSHLIIPQCVSLYKGEWVMNRLSFGCSFSKNGCVFQSRHKHSQNGYLPTPNGNKENERGKPYPPTIIGKGIEPPGLKVLHQKFCTQIRYNP